MIRILILLFPFFWSIPAFSQTETSHEKRIIESRAKIGYEGTRDDESYIHNEITDCDNASDEELGNIDINEKSHKEIHQVIEAKKDLECENQTRIGNITVDEGGSVKEVTQIVDIKNIKSKGPISISDIDVQNGKIDDLNQKIEIDEIKVD